ncbi:HipA N-terminal domain-containing protein [Parahaliea mediterranea]|uniref:HipA N-terminal domain-containing protein n=1 Tax=Parahaliea mediterranea TaxID=651086 RepID=A0A939DEY8_9GAMM|nr:HipA N-terminal domain-containing protein [Parahaliea mediterranea]
MLYQGRLAGILEEDEEGFSFTYDSEYLAGGVPISYQLKLREAAYESKDLMPFFENLVSEGWLRKLQSRQQKIDENDRFGLLLANGRDLVGAVTVEPPPESEV